MTELGNDSIENEKERTIMKRTMFYAGLAILLLILAMMSSSDDKQIRQGDVHQQMTCFERIIKE